MPLLLCATHRVQERENPVPKFGIIVSVRGAARQQGLACCSASCCLTRFASQLAAARRCCLPAIPVPLCAQCFPTAPWVTMLFTSSSAYPFFQVPLVPFGMPEYDQGERFDLRVRRVCLCGVLRCAALRCAVLWVKPGQAL